MSAPERPTIARPPLWALAAAVLGVVGVGCGGSSSSPRPEPVGVRVGSWAPAGVLAEGRGGPAVSTLANGSVLVAGGQALTDNTAKASVEIYDPTGGQWRVVNAMAAARTGHTGTVLADGRVLEVGGVGLNTAEVYDPKIGTWSAAGAMSSIRFSHAATLLPNGKVLVTGGYAAVDTRALASADLYDPATNSWSPAAPMEGPRGLHTSTLLPSGKVLVVAGNELGPNRRSASDATSTTAANGLVSAGRGEIATAELFDPASGTWAGTGALKTARSAHTATVLKDGKVLVVAGFSPDGELASAEVYNPTTGAWSTTAPLVGPRAIHAAALLPDGQVLVMGGQEGRSGEVLSSTLPTASLYDPATAKWTRAADLGTARTAEAAVTLASGQVLVVGGLNSAGPVAEAEMFSPTSKAVATSPAG